MAFLSAESSILA